MKTYLAMVTTVAAFCMPLHAEPLSMEELEKMRDNTIRSACHGYAIDMLPEFLSSLKAWLYEGSPFCRDLLSEGDVADFGGTLERHDIVFTEADSARIQQLYEAWRFADIDTNMACQYEYMCMHVRQTREDSKNPVSQKQYDHVAEYCQDDPSQYSCIQEWFQNNWDGKDVPTLPRIETAGLSFDDLMGNPSSREASTNTVEAGTVTFDALMGSGGRANGKPGSKSFPEFDDQMRSPPVSADEHAAYAPDLGFDNIHAGRRRVSLDKANAALEGKSQTIASQCRCARNGDCFKVSEYLFDQLNEAISSSKASYEQQKRGVCNKWAEILRGRIRDDIDVINGYLANADVTLKNLATLDHNYVEVVKVLDEKQKEVQLAIQQQEEEQRRREESAFAAAVGTLVVGAAVGSSLDIPIDADALANAAMEVHNTVASGGTFGEAMLKGTQGLIEMVEVSTPETVNQTGLPSLDLAASDGFALGGDLRLVCKTSAACAEYTFNSAKERQRAASQCANVVSGACPAGPACEHVSGVANVITYTYNRSSDHVKSTCESSGGRFIGG